MPPETYDAYLERGLEPANERVVWRRTVIAGRRLFRLSGLRHKQPPPHRHRHGRADVFAEHEGEGGRVVSQSECLQAFADRRNRLDPESGRSLGHPFPQSQAWRSLATVGNTDWWWYVSGDYGGGNWTIKRGDEPGTVPGETDQVDYNDIRVAWDWNSGDWIACRGFRSRRAFDRQLI